MTPPVRQGRVHTLDVMTPTWWCPKHHGGHRWHLRCRGSTYIRCAVLDLGAENFEYVALTVEITTVFIVQSQFHESGILCVLYQQHPIPRTPPHLCLITTFCGPFLVVSQASLARCVYASLHSPAATDDAHLLQRHSIGQASEQLQS
jgi:hypothetical protein